MDKKVKIGIIGCGNIARTHLRSYSKDDRVEIYSFCDLEIDKAEEMLHDWGFLNVRVRHHGDIARIELDESDFARFMEKENRNAVAEWFRELGFKFTCVDIEGYKSGSMS